MKTQRLVLILTVVNLVILAVALVLALRPGLAPASAQILRGRGLEIYDEQGRLRAQILLTEPSTVDGVDYPEGVLFRLIDTQGGPNVKIGTSVNGSGLLLESGEIEQDIWAGVQILAEGSNVRVTLRSVDGRERVFVPEE